MLHIINSKPLVKLGPYLPGSSIQTDGLQIKVPVVSLRNVTPNLNKLFDRGYSGIPKNVSQKDKVDLTTQKRGIFRACNCLPFDPTSDRPVQSYDPGHIKVLCGCSSTVSEVYNKREETCRTLKDNTSSISNKDYHTQTGSIKFQEFEKMRRNVNEEYQHSISDMAGVVKKTCNLPEMTSYVKKRLEHEGVREKELHRKDRRGYHFFVYKRQQKAIASFVRTLLGGKKEVIVFFGDGTFAPGGHGYAAVPKKKFIRQLAQFAVVILTNEYRTSKCCPICYLEVEDIEVDSQGERIRMCPTSHEGLPCFKADRDCNGCISIVQKGVFALCGTPLSAFERA